MNTVLKARSFLNRIPADDPFAPLRGLAPDRTLDAPGPSLSQRAWSAWMRWFNAIFLLVPVVLAAGYLYLFASDGYQVDSILAIRNPTNNAATATSMSGFLMGAASGGSTSMERAIDESYAVVNFIRSREAFDELEQRMKWSEHYQQPSIDGLSRLSPDATHEQRYKYYLAHTDVSYDDVEGQVDLTTYGYDAETTFLMAQELSRMSEQLVNRFNERARSDMIGLAKQQVTEAQDEMRNGLQAMTELQIRHGLIDPSAEAASYSAIITALRQQAVTKRAELGSLATSSRADAPRTVEIGNMLAAIDSQIKLEQDRLTGQTDALAPLISSFKILNVDQQLAQQKYASAMSMLQSAQLQSEHQKLYVVNIVPPTLPGQPILPNRSRTMWAVIGATVVAWLLMRLILASIRDHRV